MAERKPELIVRISGKKPMRLYNVGSYPSFRVTTDRIIAQNVVNTFANKISEYFWDGEKVDLLRIPFIKPLEIKVEGTLSKTLRDVATYKNLLVTTNYDGLKMNDLKADNGYVATFNPTVDHGTMPPDLFFDFRDHVREITGAKEPLKGEDPYTNLLSVI